MYIIIQLLKITLTKNICKPYIDKRLTSKICEEFIKLLQKALRPQIVLLQP